MKKNYIKPEIELVEMLATEVIAASIGFGEDLDLGGGVIEDSSEIRF